MSDQASTHQHLVDELCAHLASVDLDDPSELRATAATAAARLAPLLTAAERDEIVEVALARTVGLGQIEALLADPHVNEVMVNAGSELWVERAGRLHRLGRLTRAETELIIERVVTPLGRRIDRRSPIVDARLPDGSRVCAVIPPIAVDGPTIAIRRFAVRDVPLEAFASADVTALLAEVIDGRCNVLVSGATSSGKTTLLNAAAGRFPRDQRIVTLEDTAELRLAATHVVRLESRDATAEGVTGIGLDALVRTALRLRPDRLIVGEVRGAEALDMVQALSTGHDGSWATVHANGPADAIRRVESMVWQAAPGWPAEAVRALVRHAIDVVIHVARAAEGKRTITEIAEVVRPPAQGDVGALASDGAVVGRLGRRRAA